MLEEGSLGEQTFGSGQPVPSGAGCLASILCNSSLTRKGKGGCLGEPCLPPGAKKPASKPARRCHFKDSDGLCCLEDHRLGQEAWGVDGNHSCFYVLEPVDRPTTEGRNGDQTTPA